MREVDARNDRARNSLSSLAQTTPPLCSDFPDPKKVTSKRCLETLTKSLSVVLHFFSMRDSGHLTDISHPGTWHLVHSVNCTVESGYRLLTDPSRMKSLMARIKMLHKSWSWAILSTSIPAVDFLDEVMFDSLIFLFMLSSLGSTVTGVSQGVGAEALIS